MQSTAAAAAVDDGRRPWEDLVPELLGRIAGMCPNHGDRARFRSVCRSWRLAVRHHCCPLEPPPPWVVLSDGSFLMLSDGVGERQLPSAILHYSGQADAPYFCQPTDGGPHRLHASLPEDTCVVGSTDGWLALCRGDRTRAGGGHGGETFLLHNPFSNTTVPLPGVDAVCAKATALGEWFRVFKVLLIHSSGIVVVISQSRSYPFVLSSLLQMPAAGKAAGNDAAAADACSSSRSRTTTWTPAELHAPPYMHIIDVVAFVGDDDGDVIKLYGITRAEDLFCFDISLVNGVPVVTRCERLIRHPLDLDYSGYFDYDDYCAPWSDQDEDDQEEEDDDDNEEENQEDVDDDEEEVDDDEEEDILYHHPERKLIVPSHVHVRFDRDNSTEDNDEYIIVIRHLVESCGKLIMVRRELQSPRCLPRYTRKVEVFQADTEAGIWLPVNNKGLGLAHDGGGGQALFLSQRSSKCVVVSTSSSSSGYGDGAGSNQQVKEDSIYFMDTGEAFDMKSGTISPRRWCLHYNDGGTWVFPPDLVV